LVGDAKKEGMISGASSNVETPKNHLAGAQGLELGFRWFSQHDFSGVLHFSDLPF